MRVAAIVLLCAAGATPDPGRHLNYAESSNRLVYAFVFGSKSTCRVIRRKSPPRFELTQYLRRPPGPGHKGEPGDTILAEFDYRGARPVHMVPTNRGGHLLEFVNRAPDGGRPASDRLRDLGERGYAPVLEYDALPRDDVPGWPPLPRALRAPKPEPAERRALSYAFVAKEVDDGRVLVARQSETGPGKPVGEFVCFVVEIPSTAVELPADAELLGLLGDDEGLFRAGAAWALGHRGARKHVGALKAALVRAATSAARAEIARAIVRCGDAAERKTLRALLEGKDEAGRATAAAAVATLPPDRRDADALVAAAAAGNGDAARSLARLGPAAVRAVVKLSRARRPEERAVAARILGRMDDAGAEKRLLELVGDGDETVQTAAAVALTAPPRAPLPEHHARFAKALLATKAKGNRKAARRLSILAAHAAIRHDDVVAALVELASFEPKAIWSLARLTKEKLQTPEDCRAWWERVKAR